MENKFWESTICPFCEEGHWGWLSISDIVWWIICNSCWKEFDVHQTFETEADEEQGEV